MTRLLPATSSLRAHAAWVRWGVYLCFFLTGATSLVFEVLWTREFVTVFGNSSYAISIVLCAYMAGLGLGGVIGGRLADRTKRWLGVYGVVQAGIAGIEPGSQVPQCHALKSREIGESDLIRYGGNDRLDISLFQ